MDIFPKKTAALLPFILLIALFCSCSARPVDSMSAFAEKYENADLPSAAGDAKRFLDDATGAALSILGAKVDGEDWETADHGEYRVMSYRRSLFKDAATVDAASYLPGGETTDFYLDYYPGSVAGAEAVFSTLQKEMTARYGEPARYAVDFSETDALSFSLWMAGEREEDVPFLASIEWDADERFTTLLMFGTSSSEAGTENHGGYFGLAFGLREAGE